MLKAAVVGGSGYTGAELLRLLAVHPEVQVTAVTSRQEAGRAVTSVFPSLSGPFSGYERLTFQEPDPERLRDQADVFFTAVPHKTAMEIIPDLLQGGKVVDLSADFRFRDPDVYSEWYVPHTAKDLLKRAVYGLPELHRDEIRQADLVGNPGCYVTSVILGAAPLIYHKLINPDDIIADSKSGVSGAGRGLSLTTHFCEIDDGFMAYKVTGHRHTPEIEQELSAIAGRPVVISFTPHLVPMSRGILSTVYAPLADSGVSSDDLHDAFSSFYKDDCFIRVRKPGELPNTLDVRGTNYCDISVFKDERTNRVKAISVIDNLTRGASGQAVCNMNLMTGLPEQIGLTGLGMRP